MLSPAALVDHHDCLPGQAAGQGARCLGCGRRRRRRDRRPRRRRPHRGRRLAPHLLRQHPRRDRTRCRRTEGHPGRHAKPRWRGLDVPGAVLGTASLATLVFAITQADQAGWGSTPRRSSSPTSHPVSTRPPSTSTTSNQERRRIQYSPLITKYEPRIVPASFDFCRANLNRSASSSGTSIPSESLNPTARFPGRRACTAR